MPLNYSEYPFIWTELLNLIGLERSLYTLQTAPREMQGEAFSAQYHWRVIPPAPLRTLQDLHPGDGEAVFLELLSEGQFTGLLWKVER